MTEEPTAETLTHKLNVRESLKETAARVIAEGFMGVRPEGRDKFAVLAYALSRADNSLTLAEFSEETTIPLDEIMRLLASSNTWFACTPAGKITRSELGASEYQRFVNDGFEFSKPKETNGSKPQIVLPSRGKLTSEFAIEVADNLKNKKVLFYRQHTGEVVEVTKIKVRKDGREFFTGFKMVPPNRFVTICEAYIDPVAEKYDGISVVHSKKSMTVDLAAVVLVSDQLRTAMPTIERIFTIPLPIIYNGVVTFPTKGYDSQFASWLSYDAPDITNPTMSLAEAKDVLLSVYKDFCFKSRTDYHMSISALITPFLRGLFPSFNTRTPVFVYEGNRERVGKDYCAGITGIVHEGFDVQDPPISTSENAKSNHTEEFRKGVLSALIAGRKRLHYANNKGFINNAAFEAFITAQKYRDRILGKSETITLDNEVDISLSGNTGIGYTPDFANRSRFVRFFLDLEDANARTFERPNLHGWVAENRGLILSALYALVRNWMEKGQPPGSLPFASFPEWARICGGIMEAAGYENPCARDTEAALIGGDIESGDMKALFKACYDAHPETYIKKSKISEIVIAEGGDIFGTFDLEKSKPDQSRFGRLLLKFIGRELGGIRMVVKDKAVRAARQEFRFTKEANCADNVDIFADFGNIGNTGNISLPLIGKLNFGNSNREKLPKLPMLPVPSPEHPEQTILLSAETPKNPSTWSPEEQAPVLRLLPGAVRQLLKGGVQSGDAIHARLKESYPFLTPEQVDSALSAMRQRGEVYEQKAGVLALA